MVVRTVFPHFLVCIQEIHVRMVMWVSCIEHRGPDIENRPREINQAVADMILTVSNDVDLPIKPSDFQCECQLAIGVIILIPFAKFIKNLQPNWILYQSLCIK